MCEHSVANDAVQRDVQLSQSTVRQSYGHLSAAQHAHRITTALTMHNASPCTEEEVCVQAWGP